MSTGIKCNKCSNPTGFFITKSEADILNDFVDKITSGADLGRLTEPTQDAIAATIQIIKKLTGVGNE